MSNETDRHALPILLLESEAAARLRCSRATVKRLRLSGELGYIPGRPVRIAEADLAAYIERKRVARRLTEPTLEALKAADDAADQQRARRYWLRRRSGIRTLG